MADHPIALLRRRLAEDFSDHLPPGVFPVDEWCRDPQFFPGATGLLTAASWAEVDPGSDGILDPPPPAPTRGVLVVANYQATLGSYRRVLAGEIGGLPTTWRGLRILLAAIPPSEVFLTNSYVGLPDLASDEKPFPTTPAFSGRCGRFLRYQIELLNPRMVVCLGRQAAIMLASITLELRRWQPWPGYDELRTKDLEVGGGCRMGATTFAAVAVQHPSAWLSSVERQRQAELIAAAATVEC